MRKNREEFVEGLKVVENFGEDRVVVKLKIVAERNRQGKEESWGRQYDIYVFWSKKGDSLIEIRKVKGFIS